MIPTARFAIVFSLLLTLVAGVSSAAAAEEREQLTPVIGNAIAEPERVLAANGRRELAYERRRWPRTASRSTR